jgi:pSer/pThr/pTyr-binding forkhead associated (FHA) protein
MSHQLVQSAEATHSSHQPAQAEPWAELRCPSQGWCFPVQRPSIVLGREAKSGTVADVVLRGSKAISRRHAVIATINPNATGVGTGGRGGAWADPQLELSCVGKNHVHVNGEMHAPGSSGVRLRDGDTLSIGGVLLGVAITGVVVVTEEGIPP